MDLLPENVRTVQDLLENDAFRAWVKDKRPEDRVRWQHWLSTYPEHEDLYEQAVLTFLAIQGKEADLTDEEIQSKVQQILDNLPGTFTLNRPTLSWNWVRWVAAASIVCTMIWWQMGRPVPARLASFGAKAAPKTLASQWKLVRNKSGQPMTVLLPEQSSVLLSANSQVRFRTDANDTLREVFLKGEGFFEVAKNPDKPFIVYTDRLTTRVLGTSFQVRSFDNEATAFVRVKSGKVTVTRASASGNAVSLAPNEEISVGTHTDQLVKHEKFSLDEAELAILNQQFEFDYVPIVDIFSQLEHYYNIPIQYDRELFTNCTFTGQLNGVPFLEKIRLICLTTESTFEIIDNHVVIHGHGCS